MNKPFYNDQTHLAEAFQFIDELTAQTARLAISKINSYKLSLITTPNGASREELGEIIKNTLLNYTAPITVLAELGFFEAEADN